MLWVKFSQRLSQNLWTWRGVGTVAPMMTALVLVVRLTGWLQPLEWLALDVCFQTRAPEAVDNRIVIVSIDEPDLKALGRWPMSDDQLAQLLQRIKQQQPRLMGLDLYRDLPVPPGTPALQRIFSTTPNLIGIQKAVEDERTGAIAPPPLLKQRDLVGANDVLIDGDGKHRRGLLFLTTPNGETLPGFGLLLALKYLQAARIEPNPQASNLTLGQVELTPFEANDGGYVRADAGGYQILVNFRGPGRSFRTVSMAEVMADQIPPDLFRDRLVLIGATAESLNDFFNTPYSSGVNFAHARTAGVEVQANLISQILSAVLDGRRLIRVWPDLWEGLWILAWATLGALLSWWVRSPLVLFLGTLSLSGSLVLVCLLSFWQGWWIPVVPPLLALVGSVGLVISYVASLERQDRQSIMNLFGRHVTPQIAEAIWRDRHQLFSEGRLPGRTMIATVLFTDLQDFCTIAERMDPETLMCWLNEYMDAMTQVVFKHGGIIDKFMGDAVMAVFGVPIPSSTPEAVAIEAQQAVRCALAMGQRLQELNQQWQQRGYPTAAMRVGISTGPVVTGSLGGIQRVDYTTIGDSVNVASRLESYDKNLKGGICRILISDQTYSCVREQCVTEFIGTVPLKGRKHPVQVYQVLQMI